MASKLEIEVLTDISDSVRDFKKLQTQATRSIGKIEKSTTGLSGALRQVGQVAAGVLTAEFFKFIAVEGVRAVKNLTLEFAALGDQVAKTADKLGVGIEELQELQFVADRAGISTQTFNTGLQRFIRRTAEASQGTGEARKVLAELGIQLKDNNNQLRPAEELLGDVADAFTKVRSQSERVRIAFKLFDTEGVDFVRILGEGREGLSSLRQEARALGIVINQQAARDAERFTDSLTNLKAAVTGVRNVLGQELIPALTEVANAITEFIKENRTLIRTFGSLIGNLIRPTTDLDIQTRGLRARIAGLNTALAIARKTPFQGVIENLTDALKDAQQELRQLQKDAKEPISARPQTAGTAGGVAGGQTPQQLQEIAAAQQIASSVLNGIRQGAEQGAIAVIRASLLAALGPVGAFIGEALAFFAQGTEAVKQQIDSTIQALPDVILTIVEVLGELPAILAENIAPFIDKLAEGAPRIITAMATNSFRVPIAIAKNIGPIIRSLVEAIPEVAKALADAIIKEVPKIAAELARAVFEAIKDIFSGETAQSITGGTGGLISPAGGASPLGGLLGGIGGLFGFQHGGIVGGAGSGDSQLIAAEPGELVVDRDTTRQLQEFLAGERAPQPVTINLEISQEQLASVLLNLDRQGFRVSA